MEIDNLRHIQDIQMLLRAVLRTVIQPGDRVLDATAGKGRDTEFLAECVGETGKVYAFDVQEMAINETMKRLQGRGLQARVRLIMADHARLLEFVSEPLRAAMFNLGYLPGSDRVVTTKPESTISALSQILDLLQVGGIIAITVYRGHEGGQAEAQALQAYLATLPKKYYSVLEGRYINQGNHTPYWILMQKNREA